MAELLVKISGDGSGLRKELAATKRQLNRAFGSDSLGISDTATTLLGGIAVAMGALGVASVGMSSKLNQAHTAFEVLLESGDKASKMISDLQSYAASTSFNFEGLSSTAKSMLAVGIEGQDILPIIASVGDAIGTLGGGTEALQGVVRALAQIQAKGKLSAEEMNQLSERGIPGWKYLAESMGKTTAEVMKMTTDGAVDSTTAINAIVGGMATQFKGGAEKANNEITGQFESMKETATNIMAQIGDSITKSLDLKNVFSGINESLGQFAAAVQGSGVKAAILAIVPPEATAAVFVFSGVLVSVGVAAMYLFGASVWVAMAPLLPFIAAGAALGLVGYEIWRNWESLGNLFGTIFDVLSSSDSTGSWATISNAASKAWDTITSATSASWSVVEPIVKAMAVVVGVAAVFIVDQFENIAKAVNYIYDGWGSLSSYVEGVWNSVTAIIANAWNWITSTVADGINYATNIISEGWAIANEVTGGAWDAVASTIGNAWDSIKSIVASSINWVIGKMQPLLNMIGVSIPNGLTGWFDKAASSVERIKAATDGIKLGFDNTSIEGLVSSVTKPNTTFTGLHGAGVGTGADAGTAGASGGGGKSDAEKEYEKIEKKAEQVTKAIEKEWVQTTKTELEQLDIWKKEQIDDLDVIKAEYEANGQDFAAYEDDKAKVSAVYSSRRLKILRDEAQKAKDIYNTIRDTWQGMQGSVNSNTLTGNNADLAKMVSDHQSAINSIGDKWDQLSQQYATSTAAEKALFIKNLNERGVAYANLGNDEISFDANKLSELKALNEKYNQDLINRHATCKDIQSDIDAAYNANSLTMLQAALTQENAIRQSNYDAQKTMMDLYQQASADATLTWAEVMSRTSATAYDGFKTGIADVLSGTESIGEAWSELGNVIRKVIANMVAEWIAGRMAMALFGEKGGTQTTAKSVTQGAATAAAWWPAAIAVSLATFGANSGPAIGGMAAASVAGMALGAISGKATGGEVTGPGTGTSDSILTRLSNGEWVMKAKAVKSLGLANLDYMNNTGKIPGYATGGLVTGPSLSSLSGRYTSVSPAIKQNRDNATSASQQTIINSTTHVSTIDAVGYKKFLKNGGGSENSKYLARQAKMFAMAGVTR